MTDYYSTLGVQRGATPDEIKRAYRKMASTHHPDKSGGDKTAFQNIQKAYETLSDPQKRAQYDSPAAQFNFGHVNPGQGFDFDAIFDIFGARFQHGGPQRQQKQIMRMSLWITLEDVARGGKRTVSVGTQHGVQAVQIDIPQGINEGDAYNYQGIGPGGIDLIIDYRVHPHPRWQRNGFNLITDHHIGLWDCILGGESTITDILGQSLQITIPPRTQPGAVLRLKGRGLPSKGGTGDLLVRVQAQIPEYIDPLIIDAIRENGKNK